MATRDWFYRDVDDLFLPPVVISLLLSYFISLSCNTRVILITNKSREECALKILETSGEEQWGKITTRISKFF